MSTPNPQPATAPATAGNQPTETVSALHRLIDDAKATATGLNGEIQGFILEKFDEAKELLHSLEARVFGDPTTATVVAPPTAGVAQPGTEAHEDGTAVANDQLAAAEQERAEQAQQAQSTPEQASTASGLGDGQSEGTPAATSGPVKESE